jgi:hypothetical protein
MIAAIPSRVITLFAAKGISELLGEVPGFSPDSFVSRLNDDDFREPPRRLTISLGRTDESPTLIVGRLDCTDDKYTNSTTVMCFQPKVIKYN